MARVYLIRHGRPASLWGGPDDDPGLDEAGLIQAKRAARALLSLPAADRPIAVASSPLRRCRETARPLADALGFSIEVDAAVGEIPTPAQLAVGERAAWLSRSLAGRWDEIQGNRNYDLWRRMVLTAVAARPGWAFFSHFVAINAVLSLITGDDRVIGFRPDHASITTLGLCSGRLIVVELGQQASTRVL